MTTNKITGEQISIKAIFPTSYSNIKAFEQCPKQFYHVKHKAEYPFVETEAIREGNAFHKAAENYIGEGRKLPAKFSYAKPVLDSLNAKKGKKFVELKMGITYDLEPCTFFSKKVWIRGIIDLLIVDSESGIAWVIDYKTGKNTKYADVDQLELMSLLVFAHYPEVKETRSGLVFVKADELIRKKYHKIDRSKLWSKWIDRHSKMMQAHKLDKWATRESGLCRAHCPVEECIHNGANT